MPERVAEVDQEPGDPRPREVGVRAAARSRTTGRTARACANGGRSLGRQRQVAGAEGVGDRRAARRTPAVVEVAGRDAAGGAGDADAGRRRRWSARWRRIPPIQPAPAATGTWSGIAAVTAAYIALRPPARRTSRAPSPAPSRATDSTSSEAAPPTAPPTIHGSRRPARSVVRSENAPNSGLQIIETRAPTPSTRESTSSLFGAIAAACWASSTWIGPNQPDMMPGSPGSAPAPSGPAG